MDLEAIIWVVYNLLVICFIRRIMMPRIKGKRRSLWLSEWICIVKEGKFIVEVNRGPVFTVESWGLHGERRLPCMLWMLFPFMLYAIVYLREELMVEEKRGLCAIGGTSHYFPVGHWCFTVEHNFCWTRIDPVWPYLNLFRSDNALYSACTLLVKLTLDIILSSWA